jgi:hypothetical protein
MLSILCHFHGLLWKRVSQSHNHREGPFGEQEPLVRDGDYLATCLSFVDEWVGDYALIEIGPSLRL